jgi:hypothetical protein
VPKEIKKVLGLAARRAQVDVGNEDGANPGDAGKAWMVRAGGTSASGSGRLPIEQRVKRKLRRAQKEPADGTTDVGRLRGQNDE